MLRQAYKYIGTANHVAITSQEIIITRNNLIMYYHKQLGPSILMLCVVK